MERPVSCIPEESLGEVLALPKTDPRRVHLRDCPRCRALVLAYDGFMAEDGAASYGESERHALDSARERLLGWKEPAPEPQVRESRSAPGHAGPSLWSRLLSPAFRPALALAAVVVVVAAVALMRQQGAPSPGVLRALGPQPLALAEPRYSPDGSVRLAWRGVANAGAYEVRFYSTVLESLGVVAAGPDTSVSIDAARMPAAYGRSQPVLYRVAALQGRDELAASATGEIQRP